jgi:uncharacterized caspase-like protein
MSLVRAVLVMCLLLWATGAEAGERLALVIGNGDYANLPILANPASDAALVAANLTKVGFKVTALTNQTQGQLKSAVAAFADAIEKAGPDTIAAFYYAGHGVQIDGTNFLIPIDAQAKTKGDIVLGAVSASDVLRTLELSKARVNVLVLDACRDNPFSQGTRSISRGLARIDAPAGSIVAYSTAPGQVAQDGEAGNSPYAAALATHLATPGLSLEDVFRKVRIDVSEKTSGAQVPWEETSLTQEVMLAGEAAATVPLVATPPAATASTDVLSAHAYQVAVGANTAEAYDGFIRQFPSAKETSLALRNREMLNDEANWRKAVESNSIGAYKIYMTLHPAGVYASEAQQRLASLATPVQARPTVAVEPVAPSGITLVQQAGFDIFGTDLQSVRDVSFDDCQSICASDATCVAVSYRADLQRCYPKSDATLAVRNAKVSYAIKLQAQNGLRTSGFEFMPQMDVQGTDIGEARAADPQACLDLCEANENCNAFAFAVKNKTCYFKSTFYDFAIAPKVVSGVRRQ